MSREARDWIEAPIHHELTSAFRTNRAHQNIHCRAELPGRRMQHHRQPKRLSQQHQQSYFQHDTETNDTKRPRRACPTTAETTPIISCIHENSITSTKKSAAGFASRWSCRTYTKVCVHRERAELTAPMNRHHLEVKAVQRG